LLLRGCLRFSLASNCEFICKLSPLIYQKSKNYFFTKMELNNSNILAKCA
jgi:hypothetical protein